MNWYSQIVGQIRSTIANMFSKIMKEILFRPNWGDQNISSWKFSHFKFHKIGLRFSKETTNRSIFCEALDKGRISKQANWIEHTLSVWRYSTHLHFFAWKTQLLTYRKANSMVFISVKKILVCGRRKRLRALLVLVWIWILITTCKVSKVCLMPTKPCSL